MEHEFKRLSIDKAIRASQRCQRNWDLTQIIDDEDVKTLQTAVTQCASKQNDVYYKVKFITDRTIIEAIHEQTKGFTMEADDGEIVNMSNSQTLANLLVVFCEDYDEKYARSEELQTYFSRGENVENLRYSTRETLERNRYTAVGVAADGVNSILNGDKAVLLMGIGYPDRSRSRLEHHVEGKRFPSLNKSIKVESI